SSNIDRILNAAQARAAVAMTADDALREVRASRRLVTERWRAAAESLTAADSRALVDEIEVRMTEAGAALDELESIIAAGDPMVLAQFRAGELQAAMRPLQERLGSLLTLQVQAASADAGAAQAAFEQTRDRTWSIVLLAIGIAMGLGWIVSRAITNALAQMRDAADRLAQGDLDIEVTFESEGDVGRLAES